MHRTESGLQTVREWGKASSIDRPFIVLTETKFMGRRVQGGPSVSPRVRAGTTEIPERRLTLNPSSGSRLILGQGLRGRGPGRPPCWRTLEESCKGLGSVSLKNKQPTHTHTMQSPNVRFPCLECQVPHSGWQTHGDGGSEPRSLSPRYSDRDCICHDVRRRRIYNNKSCSSSVFNDTIQGPRAPAVKPGRITQLKLETPGAQAYCSTYYKAVRVGDSWLLLNTLNFELLNF